MRFDKKELDRHIEEKWVIVHNHKTLPLRILNYSKNVQYEGYWNGVTLNCRGMVVDEDNRVVAKGFPKFFNYEEERTKIPEDTSNTEIYEKLDGSYIQLFNYDGQWIVNSKGSFYSDHVDWAWELLENSYMKYIELPKDMTYCFELIVPQNRVVLSYGDDERLVFLAAFKNGIEVNDISPKMKKQGFDIVYKYLIPKFNYGFLKENQIENKEGYVVKFNNGERCKIKFEEYVKLHRVMTDVSSYRVWEALRDGLDTNIWLEGVPDEFYKWVKACKREIESDYYYKLGEIYQEYSYLLSMEFDTDKEFAELVKSRSNNEGQMFSLKNKRDISQKVWDMVKPELTHPFQ